MNRIELIINTKINTKNIICYICNKTNCECDNTVKKTKISKCAK